LIRTYYTIYYNTWTSSAEAKIAVQLRSYVATIESSHMAT